MPPTAPHSRFPLVGLLALGGAAFVSVTSEFLPTGLLPEMASSLAVSPSQIGLLVTIFAATVVVTAAPLAALSRHRSRKGLVILVLAVISLASLGAALAPSYGLLVVARIVGGLAHGLFWAVVGAYAAHLVPKHQIARAVAIITAGTTAAFVLGVPVGTALGHAVGWRSAFGVVAAAVAILALVIARLLPTVDHSVPLSTGEIPLPMRRDPSLRAVLQICVAVGIVLIGHNLYYTYIAPYIITVAGLPAQSVSPILFLYGGAGAAGLLLAGVLGDRYPRSTLLAATALAAGSVLAIGLAPGATWLVLVAIAAWGVGLGLVPPLLQTRLLHAASPRLRDTASAYLTMAFNAAIGGGALVGGILLDGIGLPVLPFASALVLFSGLLYIASTDRKLSPGSGKAGRVG